MIISLCSAKGGVSRSTGSLGLAGALARAFRTAVVDLDADAYSTEMGLAQSPCDDPLNAPPITFTHPRIREGNLILFRGGDALDRASDTEIASHIERARCAADIVVIDTPPDRRRPTVTMAMAAADVVVIPVLPEFQAVSGLERILCTMAEMRLNAPVRALLSRWEAQTRLARDVQLELLAQHPGLVVPIAVPRDQRAAEAPAAGVPVTLLAPRSRAATAYSTAVYDIAASAGLRIPKGAI